MSFARAHAFVFVSLLIVPPAFPQQAAAQTAGSVQRDPQAVVVLQRSIAAMASAPPSDSTATGTTTIIAGSETSQGTVQIRTRTSSETSIQFQMPSQTWSVIFSAGQANRVDSGAVTVLPLELASSSQSLYFPLPYLSGLLSNPDFSLQYVGQESLGSATASHIRVQNTFNSQAQSQHLSEFTVADIWLDSTTSLPLKITTTRRYGGGSSPRIAVSVAYSNYQRVSGVQYPFVIQESVNGTLWATTTIQSVTFNSGLTDANFPIQGGN